MVQSCGSQATSFPDYEAEPIVWPVRYLCSVVPAGRRWAGLRVWGIPGSHQPLLIHVLHLTDSLDAASPHEQRPLRRSINEPRCKREGNVRTTHHHGAHCYINKQNIYKHYHGKQIHKSINSFSLTSTGHSIRCISEIIFKLDKVVFLIFHLILML